VIIDSELFGLLLFGIGIGVIFIIILPLAFYLKGKKLRTVEDILESGNRYYSLNIFMALHGLLHYGSVFLFDWYAKRYNLLSDRNKVPAQASILFKVYFVIFMLCVLLMFLSTLFFE
jgi:sulfoxide reductase heme-binding subunit YedZ